MVFFPGSWLLMNIVNSSHCYRLEDFALSPPTSFSALPTPPSATHSRNLTDKAEIGVGLPQAKECQVPPGVRRGKGELFPRDFRGSMVFPTP